MGILLTGHGALYTQKLRVENENASEFLFFTCRKYHLLDLLGFLDFPNLAEEKICEDGKEGAGHHSSFLGVGRLRSSLSTSPEYLFGVFPYTYTPSWACETLLYRVHILDYSSCWALPGQYRNRQYRCPVKSKDTGYSRGAQVHSCDGGRLGSSLFPPDK